MRIIAGEYRSRQLLSPPAGTQTRPIPDRVKESLFSILRGNIEGAAVLDAFAGTGTIGLEALSRGAARCVLVERDRRVAEALRRNVEMLGCEDRAEVVVGDVLGIGVLSRCPRPVDLVIFDPPYEMVKEGRPGGGWDRVKGQFSRLIEFLSDGGFAVLRTPWPFVHLEEEEAEPAALPERRKRLKKKRRGDGEEFDAASEDDAGEDVEAADDQEEVVAEEAAAGPGLAATNPKRHSVDLAIPGAVGPETHDYRHTAVHLYMRKK